MSEKEIRLDQTKKVFDMLALLIKNNETCSYRYLIYDMLGFNESAYVELMSGMSITNKLVECETQKEVLDKIKEKTKNKKENCKSEIITITTGDKMYEKYIIEYLDDILELLEEIK